MPKRTTKKKITKHRVKLGAEERLDIERMFAAADTAEHIRKRCHVLLLADCPSGEPPTNIEIAARVGIKPNMVSHAIQHHCKGLPVLLDRSPLKKKYHARLSEQDRLAIEEALASPDTPEYMKKRCRALLLADCSAGKPMIQTEIAARVGLPRLRVQQAVMMFCTEGLARVLRPWKGAIPPNKKHRVELDAQEREAIQWTLGTDATPPHIKDRCRVLLLLDGSTGKPMPQVEIAAGLGTSDTFVRQVVVKYCSGGLDNVLRKWKKMETWGEIYRVKLSRNDRRIIKEKLASPDTPRYTRLRCHLLLLAGSSARRPKKKRELAPHCGISFAHVKKTIETFRAEGLAAALRRKQ